MSYITGPLLFVIGLAMIFFARPKKGKATWVSRFAFIGEIYLVAAVSFVVLGFCIAALK